MRSLCASCGLLICDKQESPTCLELDRASSVPTTANIQAALQKMTATLIETAVQRCLVSAPSPSPEVLVVPQLHLFFMGRGFLGNPKALTPFESALKRGAKNDVFPLPDGIENDTARAVKALLLPSFNQAAGVTSPTFKKKASNILFPLYA